MKPRAFSNLNMRALLSLAKYFAINAGADTIRLDHIKAILPYVRIPDPDLLRDLLQFLGLNSPPGRTFPAHLGKVMLEQATAHPSLDIDERVVEFQRRYGGVEARISELPSSDVAVSPAKNTHKAETGLMDDEMQEVFASTMQPEKIRPTPSTNHTMNELARIRALKHSLKEIIFEQDQAIEAVADTLAKRIYHSPGNGPAGVLFFLGPPATGKTYLAEMLAEHLGDEWSHLTINMASYQSDNESFGLTGMRAGYKEAQPGQLTRFVQENPRAVIVFDELEKAHPNNQNILLPLLNSGKLKDNFSSDEIDFSETIVVFTTNAGSELYNHTAFLDLMQRDDTQAETRLLQTIAAEKSDRYGKDRPVISPEILSRLAKGKIVLFNRLSLDGCRRIAANVFDAVLDGFTRHFGMAVEIPEREAFLTLLILNLAPHVDSRRIGAKAGFFLDRVTDYLMAHEDIAPARITFSFAEQGLAQLQEILDRLDGDPLKNLFRKNQTLSFKDSLAVEGDTLVVSVDEVALQRVARAEDYSGAGAIAVEVPEIKFTDIAGHKWAKERLSEIVELLRDSRRLEPFGVSAPKGVLLYGPPGTGKTMLAKALAHEADLPFIATSGAELLDLELMRSIFRRAREYAPAIVFIDEIDALGKRGNGARDVLINQLLAEIDGFDSTLCDPVFVIAATNFRENIDPALLRSGRLDLHVHVPSLDREARRFFIEKICTMPGGANIDRDKLLDFSSGMTGADLEKVRRESALEAARGHDGLINETILVETISTLKYGRRRTAENLRATLEAVAYHEAGHAILSRILNPEIVIEQVTVVPRENTLGFVSFADDSEFSPNWTRKEVMDRLCVLLAGRLSQFRQCGEKGIDSGAESDLAAANRLCYLAISRWGLDEQIGNFSPDSLEGFADECAPPEEIKSRIRNWLGEAGEISSALIQQHWILIDRLAQQLVREEVVDGKALATELLLQPAQ